MEPSCPDSSSGLDLGVRLERKHRIVLLKEKVMMVMMVVMVVIVMMVMVVVMVVMVMTGKEEGKKSGEVMMTDLDMIVGRRGGKDSTDGW